MNIQLQLLALVNDWKMAGFWRFLTALKFNGRETGFTDEDITLLSEGWEVRVKRLVCLVDDTELKRMLRLTLKLVPKVRTFMFGTVAREKYPGFCRANRDMLELIMSIFDRVGIELDRERCLAVIKRKRARSRAS